MKEKKLFIVLGLILFLAIALFLAVCGVLGLVILYHPVPFIYAAVVMSIVWWFSRLPFYEFHAMISRYNLIPVNGEQFMDVDVVHIRTILPKYICESLGREVGSLSARKRYRDSHALSNIPSRTVSMKPKKHRPSFSYITYR